ncbi:NERD nuclease [Ureibacillus massiliensis 4400831 = CIP 108448 = CCUG 49529]|uniref:NERD nuclease n=1 Tax=Ureibacillus massiliensis 4400831 = CIP 108448 = CCUG 49529 TaxID=1211035 RepID=A0A0A3JV20_9BACL|nr:nuclease-related domain-containing protein [Ureibacillus massiliensis]KGR90832.1 NERD nuclease [Ureibacillus massiliensis 4400831 = CIP 108448 = CCUG 49529]
MYFFFPFGKKKQELKDTAVATTINTNQSKMDDEYWANRKGELGEYKIDIQLDQFPKNYKHISDLMIQNTYSSTGYSQIDHMMITPYGIFVIETKNYQGTIYGGKNRKTWLVNGKFKMMSPLVQNYGHIQAIKNSIDLKYHEFFISMVSFTKRCTFKIDEELRKIQSNELVVYDIELTEFINRKVAINKLVHKKPILSDQDIESIYNTLLDANISDSEIRKQHVENIKNKKYESAKKSEDNKCFVCQKPVSDKVKTFCLSNKKFSGNIYCFEHQKNI